MRNLAGLNSFVSYELSVPVKSIFSRWFYWSKWARTDYESKVLVGFNVPPGMVRNIVQADDCVGDPVLCEGAMLYRVDGGEVLTAADDQFDAISISMDLFDVSEFELSAFVVSGTAPAELADEDGDGDVDSRDAELAGYTVLSNEVHFSVLQYDKRRCFGGGGLSLNWDIDGNGVAAIPSVCPPGPGGLGRPPR